MLITTIVRYILYVMPIMLQYLNIRQNLNTLCSDCCIDFVWKKYSTKKNLKTITKELVRCKL